MNLVVLCGHLGQKPTIKFFDSGKSVANASLAVTNPFNKQTTWFNLEIWGKLGEVLANYCDKGSHILVQGSIKIEDYTSKDGVKRQKTVIVVSELKLLDKKGSSTSAVPTEVVPDTDIPF